MDSNGDFLHRNVLIILLYVTYENITLLYYVLPTVLYLLVALWYLKKDRRDNK